MVLDDVCVSQKIIALTFFNHRKKIQEQITTTYRGIQLLNTKHSMQCHILLTANLIVSGTLYPPFRFAPVDSATRVQSGDPNLQDSQSTLLIS